MKRDQNDGQITLKNLVPPPHEKYFTCRGLLRIFFYALLNKILRICLPIYFWDIFELYRILSRLYIADYSEFDSIIRKKAEF